MSENKELKITSANYEAAYAMADDNTRKILAVLVGDNETTATPSRPAPSLSDYTTIRSYEDACVALGESLDVEKLVAAGVPNHIIAQMKLEHICKALWGGENKCQPTADGSKVWWYPVMALWTPGEISNMSDDERGALLSAPATAARLRVSVVWVPSLVARGRLRMGRSACALTPRKRQNTLASNSWNCGLKPMPTISPWAATLNKLQFTSKT